MTPASQVQQEKPQMQTPQQQAQPQSQPQAGMPQQPQAVMQPQQAPKKKNVLKIVIPLLILLLVVVAGAAGGIYYILHNKNAKKGAGDNKATEAVAEVTETENTTTAKKDKTDKDSEEETTEKATESKKKVVEVEVTAGSGESFSDGKAWIQTKDDSQKMCINTDGAILFTLDNCYSATDFVNGYSVINNSYIIDDEGNHVLDFNDDGYTLLSYESIDVSRVLLSKYVDTYDLAGTIVYVADLETGDITQCNMPSSVTEEYDYDHEYDVFSYMGKGYYYPDNISFFNGSFDLYDCVNNKSVTVTVDDTTASTDSYSSRYISGVEKIGDSSLLKALMNNTLYIIDLDTLAVKKKLDDVSSWSIKCYGDELFSYSTVTYSEKNTWYYDIGTDELFQLTTEYDTKGYTVLDYENGYFLLSTYNDIGSVYITLVDKTGATVIDPAKYSTNPYFESTLHDGYYSYYCDGNLYFANANDPSQIGYAELLGDDSSDSVYSITVQKKGTILVETSNGYYYAYSNSGDIIFENKKYQTDYDDIQDGYRLIKNTANNTVEYWDEYNQKLKIIKSEVYDPDDYKAAYRKALEEDTITLGGTSSSISTSLINFKLCDLDNDGAEEILLRKSTSSSDYYDAIAYNDNGEMKCISESSSYIGYYPEHSVVVAQPFELNCSNTEYYKYEDGKLTLLCVYSVSYAHEDVGYAYLDSDYSNITQDEFNKILKKAVGSEEMKEFATDWIVNTEANRETYLE
jgi:hypothetical protein